MTIPFWCLLGFAGWTVALLLSVGAARGIPVLRGQKRASEFTPGVPHGSDRYWRLNRAHLNCLENLPIFAVLVFMAQFTGVEGATMDNLARVILAGRIGQSITHISSGSDTAVLIRFSFFGLQVISFIWMGLHVVSRAGA
jgi:uncharacterized MAPEG superfamily protein